MLTIVPSAGSVGGELVPRVPARRATHWPSAEITGRQGWSMVTGGGLGHHRTTLTTGPWWSGHLRAPLDHGGQGTMHLDHHLDHWTMVVRAQGLGNDFFLGGGGQKC